ncbi:MAG: SRPBCC family protein [Prevotella sp.]|nr:SRPBCC family protein [Prevotella sp.]
MKQIPYSQEAVYRNISDLRNLEKVRDRIPEDKVKDFSFDADTISINVPPVGELKLRVVEREEPKCVKFETAQSPVPFNVWVQMLPVDEQSSKMKVTVKAELNPFIKGMVSGPLQDGVEKIANALAKIEYV